MKTKISIFFFLLSVLVLSSCSKDDDDSGVNPSQIIGTWELVNSAGWMIDEEEGDDKLKWNDNEEVNYLIFQENGKGVNYEENIIYSSIFSWELDGSKLIITEDGDSYEGQIKTLTSSKLVVFFKVKEEGYSSEWTETYKKIN